MRFSSGFLWSNHLYCHILGVCMTYKMGFGFDDQIIGPVYKLLQHFTNHYLWLDTLGFWPHYTTPLLLQLNYQLLVASHYIASAWTTQKTHPLPSSGWPLLFCIRCHRMCLLSRCLAMGLCVTIWKNSYRYCIQRFICKYWQEWVSTKLW
jgi:hypothetical protein